MQQEVQVELEKKKTPKEKYSKRELTYTRYVLMTTCNKYSQLIFLLSVSGDTIQVITIFRKHGTNSHFSMAWLFWDEPLWRCELSDICKVGSYNIPINLHPSLQGHQFPKITAYFFTAAQKGPLHFFQCNCWWLCFCVFLWHVLTTHCRVTRLLRNC